MSFFVAMFGVVLMAVLAATAVYGYDTWKARRDIRRKNRRPLAR